MAGRGRRASSRGSTAGRVLWQSHLRPASYSEYTAVPDPDSDEDGSAAEKNISTDGAEEPVRRAASLAANRIAEGSGERLRGPDSRRAALRHGFEHRDTQ